MKKTTIMEVMGETVAQFGSNIALKTKRNGRWETMTWREYYHQVKTTARAFMALGLEPGKAVNILGNNGPQWFISDLAAIFAGLTYGTYSRLLRLFRGKKAAAAGTSVLLVILLIKPHGLFGIHEIERV